MRRWPLACACMVLLAIACSWCARKPPVAPGLIVFLGDSITAGYDLESGQAFPSSIHLPGLKGLNLGISGDTSGEGLQRLRNYFASGGDPQLVVIELGVNDILRSVPITETETNLAAAVHACQSRGIPVLLCGVRIPMRFGTDEIFAKVASDARVPLLPDILDGLQNQDGLLQDDGHPTSAGQQMIAQKVQAKLLVSFSFAH